MNEFFQYNKRSLFLLISLLLLFALVLYFLLLRPLLHEVTLKEKQVSSLDEDITFLEQQLAKKANEPAEIDIDQLKLEKKIPMERKLDDYILNIQQMEMATGSKIEKISFIYDSKLRELEEDDEIFGDLVDEEENMEEDGEEVEEAPIADTEVLKEKPDTLEAFTVKLTAVAPDFEALIKLLKEIENEERISVVTHLKFLKPAEAEQYLSEAAIEAIPFEADLTTFYYTE